MLTLAAAALLLGLLFARRAYWSWVASGGLLLLGWLFSGPDSWLSFSATAALFGALAFVFGQPQRRCRWITPQLMPRVGRLLPRLGETERIALEAGTVWWDKELFSGAPSWQALLAFQARGLSESERASLVASAEKTILKSLAKLQEWERGNFVVQVQSSDGGTVVIEVVWQHNRAVEVRKLSGEVQIKSAGKAIEVRLPPVRQVSHQDLCLRIVLEFLKIANEPAGLFP